MKIYLVARFPCEHKGQLCEPIGLALTESEAVAMCEQPIDSMMELEAGVKYPIGQRLSHDVRSWYPLCPEGKTVPYPE